MAKVFATEVLSLNGSNIKINALTDGNFQFLNNSDEVVFSRTGYDASIASLAADIDAENVRVASTQLTNGVSFQEISYTPNFPNGSNPTVVATLTSSDANDLILGVQLSGTPSSGSAMFVFADDVPSSNYTINVLASL